MWHAQAAHAVRSAAPLAASLSLETLQRAAEATCWTDVLQYEAQLATALLGSADCAAGARALGAFHAGLLRTAKQMADAAAAEDDEAEGWNDSVDAQMDTELDKHAAPPEKWEHASAAEVTAEVRAAYTP